MLLSIVIPTKNRYETLNSVVKTLFNIKDFESEIEVIIQDNSDENNQFNKELLNHKNIKYFYNSDYLTVSQNCNLAVSNASADYVLMIGDDDTVSIDILYYIKHLKRNNIDSASCKMARYFWKGVKNEDKPFISIPHSNGKISYINSKDLFNSSLACSFQEIRYLPRCYHGICSKSALDNIYKQYRSYFPGPSPDMSNAVALLLENPLHVYIDRPLVISGYSSRSTAGMGQNGKHIGKIEDQSHLDKDLINSWPKNVMNIWTGETIWYVSAYLVLKQNNNHLQISTNEMNARIFYRYGYIFPRSLNISKLNLYINCLVFIFKKFKDKIKIKDFSFFKKVDKFEDITIEEFQFLLHKVLTKK